MQTGVDFDILFGNFWEEINFDCSGSRNATFVLNVTFKPHLDIIDTFLRITSYGESMCQGDEGSAEALSCEGPCSVLK